MGTDTCETCRAVLNLLTGAGVTVEPVEAPFPPPPARAMPDLLEPPRSVEPVAAHMHFPSVEEAHVRKLVLLRRGYKANLENLEEDSLEHATTTGIMLGFQLAIDSLSHELDLAVDDPPPPKPRTPSRKEAHLSSAVSAGMSPYAIDLLRAAVQLVPVPSKPPCTDVQIAVLAGKSIDSSTFAGNMAALISHGRLVGSRTARKVTPEGYAEVGTVSPMPRGAALLALWQSKLEPSEGALLASCVRLTRMTPGGAVARDAIARGAVPPYSVTSSTTAAALSKLRKLGLMDQVGRCMKELL